MCSLMPPRPRWRDRRQAYFTSPVSGEERDGIDRTDAMAMRRTTKRTGKGAASDPTLALPHTFAPPREATDSVRRETAWSDLPDDAFAADDADETPAAPAEAAQETDDAHAPDDALGLYLRQMGAIPLLSRDQELALAERLELKRRRYRHAAMMNWRTLAAIVDTFERVRAGQLALDPTIDVVTTLGLSRDRILQRMPHNLRTLHKLIETADADFRRLRASSSAGHNRMRRDLWRRLRKAVRLAEELSPRIDLLDRWTDELRNLSRQMVQLDLQKDAGDRSSADRERRTKAAKQLRDLTLEVRSSSEDLARLVARPRTSPRRISEGPPRAGRGQPAPGRVDRQALSQSRSAVLGPHSGRQSRPDARGGQVRASPGLQVRHLRDVVDSSGHHPRPGRSRSHHPRAVPSGRHPGRRRARARRAVDRAGARADGRRDRRRARRDGGGDAIAARGRARIRSACTSRSAATANARWKISSTIRTRPIPASKSISTCCANASPRCYVRLPRASAR